MTQQTNIGGASYKAKGTRHIQYLCVYSLAY